MNNHGASLIAAIFILLILSLFGAALCVLVATEADTSVRDIRARQALGLAEAGIDIGLWNLHRDFARTWAPDPAVEYPLGSGTFALELTSDSGGSETLTCSGYVPNMAGAEAKRVTRITGNLVPDPLHEFYGYALWFDGRTTFDYSQIAITTAQGGHFYAGGDIVFKNGSGRKILGTVSSTGTVTKESWSGKDPWRRADEGVDEIAFPPLDDNAEAWYRQNAFSVLSGDLVLENVTRNLRNGRIYLIEGNLTVGNLTIRGTGATVALGDVTITGDITYQGGDGPLGVVAFGDIHCNQNADIDASVYAGGVIRVSVASTIVVNGNIGSRNGLSLANGTGIDVDYDTRLRTWSTGQNVLPTSPSRTFTWREVYK